MRWLPCALFLLCLACAGIAPAASGPAGTPGQPGGPWEQIVQALAQGLAVEHQRQGDRILFVVTSRHARASLSAGIWVAPRGTFLDKAAYEKAYAAAREDERRRMFPAGGMRAMLTSVFFGPGGSSSAIVSTTSDERFDVRIVVADTGASHLSGDEGFFDVFALNERLHRAYEAAVGGR